MMKVRRNASLVDLFRYKIDIACISRETGYIPCFETRTPSRISMPKTGTCILHQAVVRLFANSCLLIENVSFDRQDLLRFILLKYISMIFFLLLIIFKLVKAFFKLIVVEVFGINKSAHHLSSSLCFCENYRK